MNIILTQNDLLLAICNAAITYLKKTWMLFKDMNNMEYCKGNKMHDNYYRQRIENKSFKDNSIPAEYIKNLLLS